MNNRINILTEMKVELEKPFPYKDIKKIQDDFQREFISLSDNENSLTGDFNSYCMNIAGTLSYVLAGNTKEIPKGQIDLLRKSFFDLFTQYQFLEQNIHVYKDFYAEYSKHEEARQILLILVK
ncbi:YxiJ family protein [Rossellomorea sp. NPDC071047]|uniref:YxiJ family protein n=1 Tax=Rossellomorea sp. NPDC071047 TaxID=3390675 RepID=UPI003D0662C0